MFWLALLLEFTCQFNGGQMVFFNNKEYIIYTKIL